MFLKNQPENQVDDYKKMLQMMGSLSNLFSENTKPYIDSRVAEKLFCLCLDAQDVSRSDCTADATKNAIGIGVKTFLKSSGSSSVQKIAEFNSKMSLYEGNSPEDMIRKIATFRNDRVETTKRAYGLDKTLYHCIVRDEGKILIVECPLSIIEIEQIRLTKSSNSNIINFNDGINEYNFNKSKSVLQKRFSVDGPECEISVDIVNDPYELLKETLHSHKFTKYQEVKPFAYLPLYSYKTGRVKYVPEKSGLNQWNARGRARADNELYIPIPTDFRKVYPDFFPPREVPFNLLLPNGEIIIAKQCQDGSNTGEHHGKALMSNPNEDLGTWVLRHVLQLTEGKVVTYERLLQLGFDCVKIVKEDNENYSIDFAPIDSYENFLYVAEE